MPFMITQSLLPNVVTIIDRVHGCRVMLAIVELLMKRLFDFILSLTAFILLAILMLVVGLLVRLTSKGPILYWSDRVGRNNTLFKMPKFRTMLVDTPAVATHLLSNPD